MRRLVPLLILLPWLAPAAAEDEGRSGGQPQGAESKTGTAAPNTLRALTRILGEGEAERQGGDGPAGPRAPQAPTVESPRMERGGCCSREHR
jgi:hypothetical protein